MNAPTKPPPPHSPEDEQAALGSILLQPESAADNLEKLRVLDFYEERNQFVFWAMRHVVADGHPLNLTTLAKRLRDDGKLDEVGGPEYLSAIENASSGPGMFGVFLGTLKDLANRRRGIRAVELLELAARNTRLSPEQYEVNVAAVRESLCAKDRSTRGELLQQRRFNHSVVPPPIQAVYMLKESIVGTPGNLSAITAHIKSGKTAVVSAMIAAPMAASKLADCLWFSSSNPDGRALVHFDSEQAPGDHWNLMSRTLRRARLSEAPPWLYSYCLTGLGSKRAWECIKDGAKAAADARGGLLSLLIDGVADTVTDVNDAAECNARVEELHGMAISYACPIIGVIHFNPGGEKVRGHLGSQLERKAETNLRLDKESGSGVTTIWSERQRGAPIPKGTGPCFQWSDEAGMHVSVESPGAAAANEERETLGVLADEMFGKRPSLKYTEIVAFLTAKSGLAVSPRTADRKIKALSNLGIIRKSFGGLYSKGKT